MTSSRVRREAVVRALARVGLVWALAVLGTMFVAVGGSWSSYPVGSGEPSTAGLVLLLTVLAVGATVLAVGARRAETQIGDTP